MISFKVTINDQPAVIGGAEDLTVLTATLTAAGKLGKDAFSRHPKHEEPDIDFRLGGLTHLITHKSVGMAYYPCPTDFG